MAKTIKTFVNTGNEETNQLVDVVQGSGDKGKPTRIKAVKGARYQLQDPANKDAGPEQVRSKRVGKNLHVILGDGTDADLIVENYYEENKTTDGSSGLFGRAEDGGLYEYIPEDPIEAGTVANLKDGGSAVSQVLGGGVLADDFVLSALPLVAAAGVSPLAIAGGAAAAAAAGGGGGGGGGVTPTPVVIPSTPAVPGITDNAGAHIGPLVDGELTDDTKPVFSGKGTAGNTIKVYDGTTVIATTTVKSDGTWSVQPTEPLKNTAHSISTTESNAAGESAKSPVFNILVGKPLPPVAGEIIDNVGETQANLKTGDETDDTTPTFNGKGKPGDIVTLYDGDKVVATTTVNTDGTWSITPQNELGGGTHTLTLTESNALGESEKSSPVTLKIVTTGPATPRALKVTDNVGDIVGEVQPNGDTDDNKPEISGMGTPGTKVKVMDGVKELGTVDVKADGTWTLTPTDALSEGAHSITTVTVDAAGKQSVPTGAYVINVDTIAPAKPSLPAATDNVGTATGAIVNGTTTDDASPDFSGTGVPGDKIRVLDGTTLLGEATVGTDGKWNFTPTKPLGNGAHSITLVEIDPAGNKSEPSPALTFNVDASAVTVAITKVLDNQGAVTADVSNNGVTDDVSPTLIGTATKNAVVTIKEGTTELGKVTADADGNWSFTPTAVQTEGKHTYTAEVTTAGATQTSSIVITVDTTAPAVPAAAITDNVGPQQGTLVNGSSTDDTTPVFSGVGTPGDTIKLYDGDKVVGSTTVKPDGTWSLKPEAAKPLAEGPHALSVTATDPAGNESAKSPTTNIVVDTSAPNGGNAPLLSITTDGDNSGTVDGKELGTSETFAIKAEFDKTKVAVGDRLVVSDGVTTKVVTLTQQDIDKGFATTTFAKPAEGATLTVTAALLDATGNTTAKATDSAKLDTSGSSLNKTATIDIVAITDDSGASDFVTNDKSLTYSGTVTGFKANGDKVKVELLNAKGEVIETSYVDVTGASATTAGAGAWSWVRKAEHTDGKYTVRATIVDASDSRVNMTTPVNGTGGGQDTQVVVVDTTAPGQKEDGTDAAIAKPVVEIAEAANGISKAELADGIQTAVTLPTGTLEGDKITLTVTDPSGDKRTVDYTVTAEDVVAGKANVTVPTGQVSEDGNYSVTAVVTDKSTNVSKPSEAVSFKLDTTAPEFTSSAVATAIDENIAAVTDVYTSVTADASAVSYALKAGIGDVSKFSINAITGKVTLLESPDFEAKSSYSFTVVATDAAGNFSERAVTLAVNDLTEGFTVKLEQDTGTSNSDNITRIATINVSNLLPNATWQFKVDAGNWVNGQGSTFNATEGKHTYTVRQLVNEVVNGETTLTATLDTAAPGEASHGVDGAIPLPMVHGVPLSYYYSNEAYKDGVPMYVELPTGAAAGDKVHVVLNGTTYVADGTLLQADVNAGKWLFSVPQSNFSADTTPTFSAYVTDVAGNESKAGSALAPAPWVSELVLDSVDDQNYFDAIGATNSSTYGFAQDALRTGASKVDAYILDKTVHFTLFAQEGSAVDIYDTVGGVRTKLGTATFVADNQNGLQQWTFDTPTLTAGDHAITAIATPTGSSVSSDESAKFTFTIQTELHLDLSAVLNDDQEHLLDKVGNGLSDRIVLNLDSLIDGAKLTINGDVKDTVILQDMDINVVNDETGTYKLHEGGYWKYDLDGSGSFDLLVSDQIHRIYNTYTTA